MITAMGVEIAIMTGVIIDMTDVMIETTIAIAGIADGIAITTETLTGIAAHATTTDNASSI